MPEVGMLRTVGTALVTNHHVGSQTKVCRPPVGIKVEIRPLKSGVSVRGAIVMMHGVAPWLWGPMPILAIGTEEVSTDGAVPTTFILVVPIGVVDDVPTALS